MEFSLKDLYAVQEIQAEENLFKLIVKYVTEINFLACTVNGYYALSCLKFLRYLILNIKAWSHSWWTYFAYLS